MTDASADNSDRQHPLDVSGEEEVREVLRETIEELIEEHGLPTVFWSLDDVYDEYDQNDMREACEEYKEAVMTDGGYEPPFPIEGTITPQENGHRASLDAAYEYLTESERGNWLERAADRAAREYGEGVEVEVTFYATTDGWDCGSFELHGRADSEQRELATDGGQAVGSETWMKEQESFEVRVDGETIRLFNRVNVKKTQLGEVLNGYGTTETFDTEVELGGGDGPETPDAVTHWAAQTLDWEHDVDVDSDEWDVRVIDPTDEEVRVL